MYLFLHTLEQTRTRVSSYAMHACGLTNKMPKTTNILMCLLHAYYPTSASSVVVVVLADSSPNVILHQDPEINIILD
jgi:hypothetical protein